MYPTPRNPNFTTKFPSFHSMNPRNLASNPTSIKSKFTKGFLRALFKINRRKNPGVSSPPCCTTPKEKFQKFYKIRTAADESLAFAVGSRRAWSRAMIYRIRNQARKARRHGLVRRLSTKNGAVGIKRKDSKKKIMRSKEMGFDQENDLRKLVPGGEAMDFCSLLDEAAHYIKCLNTQVQVMRCIADFFTA